MSSAGLTQEERAKRYVGRYFASVGDVRLFVVCGVAVTGRALRTLAEDGARGLTCPDELEEELLSGKIFFVPEEMARGTLKIMHEMSGVPVEEAIAWLEGTLETDKDEKLRDRLTRWAAEVRRRLL